MSSAFAVHCCQFYRPETSAINCLAFDRSSRKIALSRADSCIEIWTLKSMPPCRERTLPYIDNASVEALAWCRGRLFATGLDGFLREWSLNALWPVNQIKVTPSAAWCMAANRTETHLAVGTEEGALVLISVSAQNVHIEKCLTRSGDRIISIAWSHDGRTIVSGSIGVIRVWDAMSGRSLSRMTVAQGQADIKNLIWSIAITKDPVIVTGDSRGVTSFWDHQTSTLISSYQSHTADVLAVCWSEERNLVFSSGIDPAICQYHVMEEQIGNKRQVLGDKSSSSSAWLPSSDVRLQYVEHIRLNLHTHDVRCLMTAEEWLVSGGVDGVLTLSKYPPKTVLNFYPFNPDNISVASSGRFVLFQYPEYLELWRLGSSAEQISAEDGKFLQVTKDPEKLAQVKCKSGCRILCSAIDADGRLIAYSDGRRTLLFHVKVENEDGDSSVVIQPIKCLNATNVPGSTALCFSTSSTLFLADESGTVQRVEIDDVICRLETVVQPKDGHIIKKLVCSRKKPLIAAITTDNNISIIDHQKLKVISVLPRVELPLIDAKFNSSGKEIIALYADGRLFEIDAETNAYTNWSKRCPTGASSNFNTGPMGFAVSPVDNSGGVIVYGDDKLALISKSDKSKSEAGGGVSDRFRHICKVDLLDDSSVVVVQIDHDRYLTDLPPSLRVKKYGTG